VTDTGTDENAVEPVHTGEVFDDPNRQAVGLDPAWVEGTGGTEGDGQPKIEETGPGETEAEDSTEGGPNLEEMTKDELLAYGQQLGISPMNAGMSKDEIRQAIDQHRAG
jgi:hypothetical protein